jgi:hypothetical protein
VSGLPRLGSDADPIGEDRLEAQRADVEPLQTRPTTGADGTVYRWWQFLGGLLGWLAAALLVWYFGHNSTIFAWQLDGFIVLAAIVLGVVGSFVAVEIVRPALVRSRRRELPRLPERRLNIDRLGRTIVGVDGLRALRGEVVVQFDREGRKWFVPAAELAAWQVDHQHPADWTEGQAR